MQNPTGIGVGGADTILIPPGVPGSFCVTSLAIARHISATSMPCVTGPDLTGLVHHLLKALVSIVEPFLTLGAPSARIDTELRQTVGNMVTQVLFGWELVH